jgi:hypothetical protein
VPFVPVPLLHVRVPFKRFEFSAEGVPPIGPIPYASDIPGVSRGTKLSYGYAALRYRLTQTFSFGIGETLYNQTTTYAASQTIHGYFMVNGTQYPFSSMHSQTEIDSSRVPGARYEFQAQRRLSRRLSLVASVAVSPAMHADVRSDDNFASTAVTSAPFRVPPYHWSVNFRSPETASEVDGSVAFARRSGPLVVTYGLRYLNYVARFNDGGRLADRNTLVMPFVSIERILGR